MHAFASAALLFTLFYQIFWASMIFKLVRGAGPGLRAGMITLATIVIVSHSFRGAPSPGRAVAGTVVLVAALALFEWARRSIRGKFFSYIYSGDTPQFICTEGPYAWIRNPFYSSYILSYVAAAIMWTDAISIGVVAVMIFYFASAARFEEGKFARSPLAEEYAAYKGRTGRFVPKVLR